MISLPWHRRWWATPGEVVGMVSGPNEKCRVTFEWDDGTHWSLKVDTSGARTHRCLWDYQAEALTIADPGEGILAHAAAELAALCHTLGGPRLAHGLSAHEQSVVNAVARNLEQQDWITGRRLRATFPEGEEDRVRRSLLQLKPRYVSEDHGDKGDYWRITLPGIIASSSSHRATQVIEAVLAVLHKLFKDDPDFSRFSLDDVVAEGNFGEDDRRFIANVVAVTGLSLGGSGSDSGQKISWTWGIPKDIERLRRCRTFAEFVAYLREGATDRPWPTAPLKSNSESEAPRKVEARSHESAALEAAEYDVALSFAGEDRPSAEQLARTLTDAGVKVFYDSYEQATLWGLNLYDHLHDVYCNRARYCVMFVSSAYATRLWTNHERQAAQARAFRERKEYILPVRIDQTTLPGLSETIGYVSITDGLDTISNLVLQKLGRPQSTAATPRIETGGRSVAGAPDGDRGGLASAAARLISRAQDGSQRLAPILADILSFGLQNNRQDLVRLCGRELEGWYDSALASADPDYPSYRVINSYVALQEVDTAHPAWSGDLSAVLDFLAHSSDVRQLSILMPQPLAELDRMAEQSSQKALLRWSGPIRAFFSGYAGPDATGYFYARGDALLDVVDRIRGRVTKLLLSYVASLPVSG